MKALLVEKLGNLETLVYREHQLAPVGSNNLIIEAKYAGVNFPDTLIIRGKYQFQPKIPFSPGGEIAGIVKEVGSKVTDFKKGDRVIAGTTWGAFAEEVQSFDYNTHKLPDEVSFKEGAAVLMTHGTIMHALKNRAKIQPNETMAILGAAGGIGTAAIQIGKAMGAKIIACASTDEKLALCKLLGADKIHKYSPKTIKSSLKGLTEGKGVNVIVDTVGGDYSEPAFRAIAPMGRHLIVGFTSGTVPAIPWNLPLLKSASIVGVFWSDFFRRYPLENKKNIHELMKMLKKGIIKPVIEEIIPLAQAKTALEKIENRQAKGKIILKIN